MRPLPEEKALKAAARCLCRASIIPWQVSIQGRASAFGSIAVPRLHFVVVLDRCTMRDAITEMARRYGEVL